MTVEGFVIVATIVALILVRRESRSLCVSTIAIQWLWHPTG